MIYSTSFVFHSVDVIVVLLSLLRMRVLATSCPGSEQDNSIKTCVDELTLDAESRSTIDALRVYYEDFPTHCRYGQYTTRRVRVRVCARNDLSCTVSRINLK